MNHESNPTRLPATKNIARLTALSSSYYSE
jgi:hypothetical protein